VGAHANEEGEKGHDTKANGHLGQVTRTSPLDAEEAILPLTAIANAFGEIAAFEGRIDLLPVAIWVRYPEHLTLAALHQAIADNVLGVEKLSSWIDEPDMKGFKRWIRCKTKRLGLPVSALDGKNVLEQGSSCYRYDMEERIRTYKGEAHRDEEKSDKVRCFSHRGELSQGIAGVPPPPPQPVCPRSSYI
jgi:hypothetical protein